MSVLAFRMEAYPDPQGLAAIAEAEVSLRLTTLLEKSSYSSRRFSIVSSVAELRERASQSAARVILIDDSLLGGAALAETIAALPCDARIILLGGPGRQTEAATHVARGEMDFVLKAGDYAALAAAMVERELRSALRLDRFSSARRLEFSADLSEIFRHEINNPLTGILGNAELLLAHRDRLPAADTQRLQTIVELAVRLRETVRRLSSECENAVHAGHSA